MCSLPFSPVAGFSGRDRGAARFLRLGGRAQRMSVDGRLGTRSFAASAFAFLWTFSAVAVVLGWNCSPAAAQSDTSAIAPWQVHPGRQAVWSSESFSGDSPAPSADHRQYGEPGAAPSPLAGGGEIFGPSSCGVEGGCPSDGCLECGPEFCGPCGQFWFRGEYLMWWGKSATLPPLVTTSATGTSRSDAGVLGRSGTSVLFGENGADQGIRSGGRFTLGYWLNPCQDSGIEAVYFFLGNKAVDFSTNDPSAAILARPFYNVESARQDALIFAYPNIQTGSLNVRASNEWESLEILVREAVLGQCDRRVDFLFGYRYGRFSEELSLDGATTYVGQVGTVPVGTIVQVSDQFSAHNDFHGAEIGFATRRQYCRWSFEFLTKLAVGSNRSRVNIQGSTVVTAPDELPVTYSGGLLAMPSNTVAYEKTDFAVIPEIGLNVGYDVTERLRATFGYTFVYWSHVARPGDQIDVNVNTSQSLDGALSGVPAPQFKFVTSDYWAQGLNFGLDYRF